MSETPEEFYDREIAPALADIAKKLEERGMSIAAVVEYEPESVGITVRIEPAAGPQMRMAYYGAVSKGNVDTLIGRLVKDAKEHGHSSAYLRMLETVAKL